MRSSPGPISTHVTKGDEIVGCLELDSRVLIEQAKGMIAEHESITMQAAFLLLRTFARNNNVLLAETARNLVEGRLSFDALTQPHVRHKSIDRDQLT